MEEITPASIKVLKYLYKKQYLDENTDEIIILSQIAYDTRITYSHLASDVMGWLKEHGCVTVKHTNRVAKVRITEKGKKIAELYNEIEKLL